MRYTLDSAARKLAGFAGPVWITLKVVSGSVLIGPAQTDVQRGDGLTLVTTDGVVHLRWEFAELWVAGLTTGVVEVLIP